jgi:hypothetical protein
MRGPDASRSQPKCRPNWQFASPSPQSVVRMLVVLSAEPIDNGLGMLEIVGWHRVEHGELHPHRSGLGGLVRTQEHPVISVTANSAPQQIKSSLPKSVEPRFLGLEEVV